MAAIRTRHQEMGEEGRTHDLTNPSHVILSHVGTLGKHFRWTRVATGSLLGRIDYKWPEECEQRKRTPVAHRYRGALCRIWARRDSNPRPHPRGVNRITPPLDPPPTWYPPTPNREHPPRHQNHPYHVRSPAPKHPAHRAHNPRYPPCEHTPLSSLPLSKPRLEVQHAIQRNEHLAFGLA